MLHRLDDAQTKTARGMLSTLESAAFRLRLLTEGGYSTEHALREDLRHARVLLRAMELDAKRLIADRRANPYREVSPMPAIAQGARKPVKADTQGRVDRMMRLAGRCA